MTLYYSERLTIMGSWSSQVTDGPPLTKQDGQPVKLRRVRELLPEEEAMFVSRRLSVGALRQSEDDAEALKSNPLEECPPEDMPGGLAVTREDLK